MKVLLAMDGFPRSFAAEETLACVGDVERLDITVLTVTHSGLPAPKHAPLLLDPVAIRRQQSQEIVDAAVERLRSKGFRASGATAEGSPGHEIVEMVQRGDYQMTVIGAGQGSWLGRALMGSVSRHVVHHSPTSVLVTHEAPRSRMSNKILLATDGSTQSEVAIRAFCDFADSSNSEVDVLSVAQPPVLVAAPGAAVVMLPTDDQRADLERKANEVAEFARLELEQAGFKAHSEVAWGHPAERILSAASDGLSDLIVVGAHSGLAHRLLLGSVSSEVTRWGRATLVGRGDPSSS